MGKDLFNPHLRKFSIRKLNVGVCSVLLSTLILLGTAAQVNADEATASSGQNEATRTDISNSTTTATDVVSSQPAESATFSVTPQPVSTDTSATVSPESNVKPTNDQTNADDSTSQPAIEKPVVASSEAKPVEKPATSSDAKPVESATVPTSDTTATQPAISVETPQPSRSRRTRREAAPTGLRDGDPNNTIAKPTLADSEKKRPADLVKQINWLDFGDSQAFRDLDTDGSLKVGSVYEKEISPGYVVKLTVTELKPFHSTEIYRDRVAGKIGRASCRERVCMFV